MKRWNINAVMCREADEEICNICNIFNKLIVNEECVGAFTIVTFMNAIECDEEKFRLHYVMEKLDDEKKAAYLGSTLQQNCGECKEEGTATSVDGVTSVSSRLVFRKFLFPGEGDYEIKIYKYDNEEAMALEVDEWIKKLDDEHLVSTYQFAVNKKK